MNILRVVSNQMILNLRFEQMQDTFRTSIGISKQKYYFKLAVNKINPNCYWSILKIFLSN